MGDENFVWEKTDAELRVELQRRRRSRVHHGVGSGVPTVAGSARARKFQGLHARRGSPGVISSTASTNSTVRIHNKFMRCGSAGSMATMRGCMADRRMAALSSSGRNIGGRQVDMSASVDGTRDDPDDEAAAQAERDEKEQKAIRAMVMFTNRYLKLTNTRLCENKEVAATVIQGLANHRIDLGAPLCPCRFYEDKRAEVADGYWNCPCEPMREKGECHCMLFLQEGTEFASDEQEITVDEVNRLIGKGNAAV